LNDKVLTNASVALAYLSDYAADPKAMQTLFDSFTPMGKTCINVAVKFGVLTNPNAAKIDREKLVKVLDALLADWLQMNSGFDAQASSADDVFRFNGAFDLIGHLSNTFARRDICLKVDSPYLAQLFGSVNKSQALKTQMKQVNRSSFELLLRVMAMVPIKSEKLSPELSELVKDAFALIQNHYLDYPELNAQCSDAILNMTQLTYDNFQQATDVKSYDRQGVKEVLNQPALQGLINDDMKMYALDIVFKKK
jgi:hypothetical protein